MVPLTTVDVLDAITIPITCPVPWDSMHGDDRTRFCNKCNQNVHDVSELTRAEALRLVASGGPTPCLRLYRRQDGRVMTADCIGKRERAWRWLHRYSPWAAFVFGLVFFAGCSRPIECVQGDIPPPHRQMPAYRRLSVLVRLRRRSTTKRNRRVERRTASKSVK